MAEAHYNVKAQKNPTLLTFRTHLLKSDFTPLRCPMPDTFQLDCYFNLVLITYYSIYWS